MRNLETSELARVISVGRNHVWIAFDDETSPRNAELRKTKAREMLVPGDRVTAERRDDGSAFVRERLDRTSALERHTPGGRKKIMAANIDTVLVAAAFDRPTLNLLMLDELIAFGELHELEPMLVFSKADLVGPQAAEALTTVYRDLGYSVFVVDARTGAGVPALATHLAQRETLIIGSSGVGKSTLFAALGGQAVIGEVSERTGQGRQTTSSGRLHRFEHGTLIDSPGIGEFTLEGVEAAEVATLWRELRPLLGHCRFLDCRHIEEPDCTLLAALAAGKVAPSRHFSYRRVYARIHEATKNRSW